MSTVAIVVLATALLVAALFGALFGVVWVAGRAGRRAQTH